VDWIRHTFNRFDEINAINERGAELARQEVVIQKYALLNCGVEITIFVHS
jgi:hypothetical protein